MREPPQQERNVNNPRAQSLRGIRGLPSNVLAGGLIVFSLVIPLLMVTQEIPSLFLLGDAGYGDSYILYDVLQFQKTGVIYRDLSQPPYLPAQYSPLLYILYSLPGRIVAWENPFLGPRLIALTAFLLCIAVVVSIVRALIPVRYAGLWGLLLASSIAGMLEWVVQLRGDFLGILFSLLAIRLLMLRSRKMVLIAGLCAGLAAQFKII